MIPKHEYEALKKYYEYISDVLLPDCSERLKKARDSEAPIDENYVFDFCREEQTFLYNHSCKIKKLLEKAEKDEVIMFPYKE